MSAPDKINRGFTLIEVVITLAIFSIMMQTIYTTMMMSQRSLNIYARTTAPKQNLRMAMATMVKELREAQNLFINKRPGEDQDGKSIVLTFQRPMYGDVKYSWTDTGDDAGKIIRTNYSNVNVLAYHITLLDFTSPSTDQIIIEIEDGTNGAGLQLKEKVALRMQTGMFAESQNETIK